MIIFKSKRAMTIKTKLKTNKQTNKYRINLLSKKVLTFRPRRRGEGVSSFFFYFEFFLNVLLQ